MSTNELEMSRSDLFSDRKAKLSPEKLALLEKLKGSKLETKLTGIPRRSGEGPVSLSFAQQRLWFLDQLVPNSPAYNVVMAFHLIGKPKVEILEQCFNEVVKRHEVLRTTFQSVNGQPFQVVAPNLNLTLPVADLTKYPEAEREDRFRQLAEEEAGYVFDLTTGPLLRVTLFRMSDEKQIMLLNVHHIVIDGWSIAGVLLKELVILYQAFSAGKPSPLPELSIQYADFSTWQRHWLQGEVLEQQLSYWREKLGKDKNVLELPLDRTRPPIQTFRGGSLKFQLSPFLSKSIKSLSEQENATLFMIMTTALKILLHRYTGQNDIRVGTPVANRNRVEIENLIGFFVNTLVLKTDLSGNPSFLEVLGRVREVANGAYTHQDVPFEALVDELQPERNMSQNPLFEVCMVLQNFPVPQKSDFSNFDFTFEKFEEIRNESSKFDLWIQILEKDDILDLDVEYNCDIFNEATIVRILDSYQILLQGIIANPGQRISELPILAAEEQHKLLLEWNDTATCYPQHHMCLHEIIDSQVTRTPNAPAVIFENEQLTYKELYQRANQLANYLSKMGVGPETLVGIYMERSLELVIGLLGILKAGGAYVPLDPTYPPERVAFMIEDANPPLLLTQQRLLSSLPEYGGQVICLDSDWGTISNESGEAKESGVNSDNLAYMIYTSGSTGKPKGAMNCHRGIVNRLLWMQEEYQLHETDRIMQKTPFSFDVSVWEFFWPLMTGACLVVARPEGHKDTTYLAQLIKKEKITTMHFVPSMLQVFLEEKEIENIDSLKRVICSGEALSYSIQERFFERLQAELHNLYGPTEAAVDVTYWACRKDSEQRIVPIGLPVANTQIYLLDEYLNPVPMGVAGELHIGGVQLARGYYNRPELTEEKFIPNPFSKEEGARLYKTGDLARYMPDGNIEYLGRIDFQVKLRGFRIELGEIEAVLEEHPGVQKAAVLVHESEQVPEHKQLVAYVIPDSQSEEKAKSADREVPGEQVSEWQTVFDKAYDADDHNHAADFNITSWNSSYTGLPLSVEEMSVWVDSTVNRILALKPRNVLEIGCGTGLLLSRIAPHCEQYWGSDFSSIALDYVANQLLKQRQDLSNVKLLKKYADDFSDLAEQNFDVVVLNSVVQYFPDIDYLLDVLKKAVQSVRDSGSIFVGDIRSLPLLEAFITEVEMEKAPSALSIELLKNRVQKRLKQEQELVVDPEFFFALQERLPQISHVEIKLKRGTHHNELTRYRYDVVLHIGKKVQPVEEMSWLDWHEEGFNIDRLSEVLTKYKPTILGVTNIPNLRLETANRYLSLLNERNTPETVEELKLISDQDYQSIGVDPEDLWNLGAELQYTVDMVWIGGRNDGRYEVAFRRNSLANDNDFKTLITPWSRPIKKWRSLDDYANYPLLDRIAHQLVPELRGYLKDKLPDYMIPTTFEFIKEMPVNSNGKLDRKALPIPIMEIPDMEEDFVAPSTPTEIILAEVWAEVLGLEKIGINNNFFEIGGDSIHSIRAVARAKERGVEFTPQQIFQYQTISELAAVISPTVAEESRKSSITNKTHSADGENRDGVLVKLEQYQLDRLKSENPDLEDIYPLTAAQDNMLYQYLHAPKPGQYVIHHVFNIKGEEFNASAFERAWQHVVNHFQALRTSFHWQGLDEPLQIVHKEVRMHLEQKDWRHIPAARQEEKLNTYIEEIRRRGFDLNRAPQSRLVLIQLAEDAYSFLYFFNLMLQDGWSYPLILKNVFASYQAFSEGGEIELEPAYPYRNYIAWQKQQDLSEAEAFWKSNLDGIKVPTPASVQPMREHKPDEGPTFLQETLMVPQEITRPLLSLAKQHHLTLYTLLQGAWALLLSKDSGQEDIVIGTIFSGRSKALLELEGGIGLYFNILPTRVQVNPNTSLLPWLQELQVKGVETSQYEYTPLRKIHDWCGIPRDRLLFESYLVSEQLPHLESTFKDYSEKMGTTIFKALAQTEHPLRVEILFFEQILFVNINYYQCYFSPEEINRMLKDLQTLLEAFVANPGQKLSALMGAI